MIHLGKTARYLRKQKNLTQGEAARALGITQVHLSNIENNRALPSPKLLDRYRELWGVDLYVLAWCLHGDLKQLPKAMREPIRQLAAAWRHHLGEFVGKSRGTEG
jgi:transcriptional regulator with XRE-family HTH domain